jgi:hypothetical protein
MDFETTEYDMMGNIDVDEMNHLASIAENEAVKLAYNTSLKLKRLHSLAKNTILSEKEKI